MDRDDVGAGGTLVDECHQVAMRFDQAVTPSSEYLWYQDLDDALLFKHQSGVFSIVPKNEATAEAIAFARGKVSPRYPKMG